MNKKSLIISSIIVIAILCILGGGCLLNNGKSYDIKITIPAGSTETYVYSDVEIIDVYVNVKDVDLRIE